MFLIWGLFSWGILLFFQIVVGCHVSQWMWHFFTLGVIFGDFAHIIYTVAFYYYFGRNSLVQCHAKSWVDGDPRNYFLSIFSLGSIFSFMEVTLMQWTFDDELDIKNKNYV